MSGRRTLAGMLLGATLALAPPAGAGPGACSGGGSDTDGDCILDAVDNCMFVPNPPPFDCDSDNDGYGNACDGDFDNLGSVNAVDFSDFFIPAFQTGTASPTGTDMDCLGTVSAPDFSNFFLPQFSLGAPGPSCCAP